MFTCLAVGEGRGGVLTVVGGCIIILEGLGWLGIWRFGRLFRWAISFDLWSDDSEFIELLRLIWAGYYLSSPHCSVVAVVVP